MAAKGYDDSPPRNGIIFFYTVLTVFMLIGVKFLLDSYFYGMMSNEVHDKVLSRGMAEVKAVRAKEAEALKQGPMPIDQAMRLIAQRGRKASPLIVPESGQDAVEVTGWSLMKRDVAGAAPAAEERPEQPEGAQPEGAQPEGAAPEGAQQPEQNEPANGGER